MLSSKSDKTQEISLNEAEI